MLGIVTGGQTVTIGLFAAVGFFGSGHCVGMCGPLVSLYADKMSRQRRFRQHLLFNAGRTISYGLLGGLFGLLGAAVGDTLTMLPAPFGALRGLVGVMVGVAVGASGLAQLAGTTNPLLTGRFQALWAPLARLSRRLRQRLDDWVDGPGTLLLGVAHGLFPCPLLYPAYLAVFTLGDPLGGMVALFALGLGTIPALLVFGLAVDSVRLGRFGARAVGGAFLVLGAGTVLAGLVSLGLPVTRLGQPESLAPTFPELVVMPVTVIGSLLVLGVGIGVLVQRQSLSYLFVVLALFAFAGQVLAGQLVAAGVLPPAVTGQLDLFSNAVIVGSLIAAVHTVARQKRTPEYSEETDQ